MGIRDIARSIGQGIASGARKVGSFISKAAPIVSRVAKIGGGILSLIPATAHIGTGILAGTAAAERLAKSLDKGEIRDKAHQYLGIEDTGETYVPSGGQPPPGLAKAEAPWQKLVPPQISSTMSTSERPGYLDPNYPPQNVVRRNDPRIPYEPIVRAPNVSMRTPVSKTEHPTNRKLKRD